MKVDEAQTERLIKEKARILFFKKGLLDATTQEIADEAGVNRALIHYYFRSKDQLLDTLLNETLLEKRQKVRNVLTSELPFREKIAIYINALVDYGLTYPYLDNFIISETARRPDKVTLFCSTDNTKSSDLIREQLEEEIASGTHGSHIGRALHGEFIGLVQLPTTGESYFTNSARHDR